MAQHCEFIGPQIQTLWYIYELVIMHCLKWHAWCVSQAVNCNSLQIAIDKLTAMQCKKNTVIDSLLGVHCNQWIAMHCKNILYCNRFTALIATNGLYFLFTGSGWKHEVEQLNRGSTYGVLW